MAIQKQGWLMKCPHMAQLLRLAAHYRHLNWLFYNTINNCYNYKAPNEIWQDNEQEGML